MNNASQTDNERKFVEYMGIRLRQRRIELGKTQTKIADYLSVTFQQVQKYEKGLNALSLAKLIIFCEATETDLSYFLRPLDSLKKNIYINRRK
jgi:transcriptional regulator with XRE-family HTH domain